MAQFIGQRNTAQTITETRLVRLVSDEGLLLEPSEQPLITFLLKAKKRGSIDSVRKEWFEEDFIARWGTLAEALDNSETAVDVVDGTLFTAGDLVAVPNANDVSTAPEIMRVTGVSTNTLTVVRAFAGSTATTAASGDALCILGTAYAEGSGHPESKTFIPVAKITYTQIFKKTVKLSRTQIATRTYAAPSGERAKQHAKMMKQMKVDMNRQFLWGKASEDVSTPTAPIRTTMGLNTVISTNVTDGGGVFTRAALETFSRQAFRYGKPKKILLASPMVISAIHQWGNSQMQLGAMEKVYGVDIQRVVTGHGEWLLVRDWMLEDGVSGRPGFGGWAYSLELDEMEYGHLAMNGENRDLTIREDVLRDGSDAVVDEAIAEVYFQVRHEKKFAKLYNVTSYEN